MEVNKSNSLILLLKDPLGLIRKMIRLINYLKIFQNLAHLGKYQLTKLAMAAKIRIKNKFNLKKQMKRQNMNLIKKKLIIRYMKK